MTFNEWWVESFGPNWKAVCTEWEKEVAEMAWKAATAAERERCAKLCEKEADDWTGDGDDSFGARTACGYIADAIRAGTP